MLFRIATAIAFGVTFLTGCEISSPNSTSAQLVTPGVNSENTFDALEITSDGEASSPLNWQSKNIFGDIASPVFTVSAHRNAELLSEPPAIDASNRLSIKPVLRTQGEVLLKIIAASAFDAALYKTAYLPIKIIKPPSNNVPTFQGGADISAVSDGSNSAYPGWASNASDNDNDTQALLFQTVSVSAPQMFEVAPQVSYPSQTLRFRAKRGVSGTATVGIRLKDNGGTAYLGIDASELYTFTITLTAPNPNNAPSFTVGDNIRIPVNSGIFALHDWACCGKDNDHNTQSLYFEIVENSAPQLFSAPPSVSYPSHTLRFAAATNAVGIAHLKLLIKDDGGTQFGGEDTSKTQDFTIEIYRPVPNHSPSFVPGADVTVPNTTGAVTLPAWAKNINDNDGDTQRMFFEILENSNPRILLEQPHVSYPSGTLRFSTNPTTHGFTDLKLRLVDDGGTLYGGENRSEIIQFRITTTADTNRAPIANSDTLQTEKNVPASIVLSASDADGDLLQYRIAVQPSHGTLDLSNDTIQYTPETGYTGPDSFDFVANDGEIDSNTATITIAVSEPTPSNQAPIASNAAFLLDEDSPLTLTLSATDADGDPLTYEVLEQPKLATITRTGNQITYTPESNNNGTDQLTFRVNDGTLNSNVATIDFTIEAVNDAPTVKDENISTERNTDLELSLFAEDAESDTLTLRVVTAPSNGTYTISGTQLRYTPNTGYVGEDTIVYVANDGLKDSLDGLIKIDIVDSNTAPEAAAQSLSTAEDTPLTIILSAIDAEGDSMTYSVHTLPEHGTLSTSGSLVIYTPNTNYNGADSFIFVANDGRVDSIPATVDIIVSPVNDAPNFITTAPDTGTALLPYSYIFDAEDPDSDTLSYSLISAPTGMTLDAASQQLNWTPSTDQTGEFAVELQVADEGGLTDIQNYTVTVSNTNQAPTITSTPVSTGTVGTPYSYPVVASDPDGDTLLYSLVNAPDSMSIDAGTGQITWTPTTEFSKAITSEQNNYCYASSISSTGDKPYVDFSVVIDHSGSMSGEHAWVSDLVPALEAGYLNNGIGESESNGYGLVSYEKEPKPFLVGGQDFGTYTDFLEAAKTLSLAGGTEDGYRAVSHVLNQYTHRQNSAKRILLVTDEPRDITDSSITYDTLLQDLNDKETTLNAVLSTSITCGDGTEALGISSDGTGFFSDGEGGFDFCNSAFFNAPTSRMVTEYANLVFASGGSVWNLAKLRAGGIDAVAFSRALVDLEVSDVLANLPAQAREDLGLENIIHAGTSLSVEVKNYGNASSISTTLSVLDATDTLLGQMTVPALVAGDSHTSTFNIANLSELNGALNVALTTGPSDCVPDNASAKFPVVTVQVEDSPGAKAQQSYLLVSTPVNLAAVFTSTAIAEAAIATSYIYQPTIEDQAGDDHLFSLIAAPDGMIINPYSGIVQFKPKASQQGTHTVTIEATDLAGLTAQQSYNLLVATSTATTSAGPRFSPSLTFINFTDSTANSIQPTVLADASLALEYVLLVGPDECSINSTSGELVCAFSTTVPEQAWIYASVQDQFARRDLLNIRINRSPTWTTNTLADTSYSRIYTHALSATDPDKDRVSFSIINGPDELSIVDSRINWTAPEKYADTLQNLTLRATDEFGAFADRDFTINVHRNRDPVINNEPADFYNVGRTYSYGISASDPDRDSLQYTFTDIPVGAVISNHIIRWTQSSVDLPSTTMAFSVSDGFGGQSNFTKNIAVFQNRAPVWTSESSITIAEGRTLDYRPKATDPDNDSITFSIVSAPVGVSVQGNYRVIWQPTLAQVGVNQVVLKAADAYGGETEHTLNVTVGQNTPPRISSVPVQSVVSGHALLSRNTAVDDDGDRVTFSLDTAPEGMTVDSYNRGYLRWTPEHSQVGQHDVTLVATDSYGGKSFLSYQITVTANNPPVNNFSPITTATSGHTISQRLIATDPDGDRVNYELISAPDGMTAATYNNGYISWNPTDAQTGDNPVSLRAYDPYGGETILNFTIAVTKNSAPRFLAAESTWDLVVGTRGTLSIATEDADGDYVLLSKSNDIAQPDNIYVTTNHVAWTPLSGQVGEHTLVIQADDNHGGISTHTITATVHNSLYFSTVPKNIVFESDVNNSTQAIASHPQGLRPTYRLLSAPADATINTANGSLIWKPTDADLGTHTTEIQAETSDGQTTTTRLSIEVIATNLAPIITAVPDQTLVAETPWQLQINATDPEAKALRYRLVNFPSGMSIDSATGLIHYTPPRSHVGARTISIYVYDDRDKFSFISINIEVTERANTPPVFTSMPGTGAVVAQLYSYTLSATDADDDALIYSLNSGPDGATLSGDILSWTPSDSQSGTHAFSLSVDDSFGLVEQSFSVDVLATNAAPVVELLSPFDGDILNDALDITGTASDAQLKRWQVLTRAVASDDDDWLILAEGTTEQNNQALASIDPSLLMNGQQIIRLFAEDNYGATSTDDITVTIEGDLKVGNFSFTLEDLNVPMIGLPIVVTRTYDSRRRAEDLDFGYGWTIDYQNAKVESSRELGKDWSLNAYSTGPLDALKRYCVEPKGAPVVTVTLPTGEVERFEVSAIPQCNTVVPLLDVQLGFNPTGDTDSTLQAVNDRNARLINGDTLVETGTYSDAVDPTRYFLTTRSGYKYLLDKDFGIEYIDDPNGNTLFYTDNGIIHSSGKAVRFQRDSEGRIVRVIDPDGQEIEYNYDANGDLTTATDRDGGDSTYSYNNNHGLVEMFDALGRKIVKNIYDADGRLTGQEDENGNLTTYNHDIAGKLSTVTDKLGNTTTLYYDERGNVTTTIDALGNTSTASFDANDNQTSVTDPLGNTQTATFNANNDQLTQSDALGNTTTYGYNTRGQETIITDATGDVFESTYDSVGNLLSVKDPEGNIAGNNINAKGLPSSAVDALGNTTTYEYDSEGNKTKETDPTGAVMEYGYDSNNQLISQSRTRTVNGVAVQETSTFTLDELDRVISSADALGNTTLSSFDLAGHEVSSTDALGNTTLTDYDVYGNVSKITYADGSIVTRSYDAEHNLLSETDALGNTTSHSYDALNRETKTTYPDGSSTENTYDAAGRMTASTDALGNVTQYEYDAAGRRVATVDALGNRFESTYSPDGNLLTETDARGNTTQYSYNALDQRTGTTLADNNSLDDTFDATGRRTASEDQAGLSTAFDYDANGRLIKVTDADGGETSYSYDEAGNKFSQTDALDRTTTWTYDALGRVLTRTLPLGQSESTTYDAVGNVATHTDFNGQLSTYTYDSRNRVNTISYAGGRSESFSYDAKGNTIQVVYTHASGSSHTVDYSYDNRDRLILDTRSDGDTLSYQYDANGNRTQVKTELRNGETLTTDYSFDALNRLSTVTDQNGDITTYAYDANGNRSSVTHANGTVQSYQYDSVNRLTSTETRNASGTVLQSFAYTLDSTGRRTAITDNTGQATAYSYDNLYRLTDETITGAVPYSANYSYDAVGNRTFETIDGISTAYTVDDNDRLLTQGGVTYTYDAQGNTLSQTDNGLTTTYSYNANNKLASSTANGITTEYRYNHNGTRTAKIQGSTTTHYVFDENRDYSQVLVELNGTSTEVSYTYGDDLLYQTRAGVSSTYHYDGLGSTRGLSDATGNLTDSYQYDAFGIELASFGTSDNDYRYTGEQFDAELDQYHLRARQYAPSAGRFTQMDSWMGNNADPMTLHKYAYANGDPANTIDPSGNFGLVSMGVANNIRSTLIEIQIDVGLSVLDMALDPSGATTASATGSSLMLGVASLGGQGAFKLLRMLSSKFRKACNSFDGDTLVATEHGPKAIKDIQIGDKVWAFNEETGERTLQPVIHLIQGEGTKELVDIELLSGEVITATANHPFYAANDSEWLEAGELSIDDLLLKLDATTTGIQQLRPYSEEAKVYNLTVANDHTYYVGVGEVLAHNAQKVCSLDGIVFGAKKPPQVRNPKHNSGGGKKGNEPAGIEPVDSEYAFQKLAVKSAKDGKWYAKSPDGKGIYRYSSGNDGTYHWSGSTSDKSARLNPKDIPSEIVKIFGFSAKGKNKL